jgi:hypothetical protein
MLVGLHDLSHQNMTKYQPDNSENIENYITSIIETIIDDKDTLFPMLSEHLSIDSVDDFRLGIFCRHLYDHLHKTCTSLNSDNESYILSEEEISSALMYTCVMYTLEDMKSHGEVTSELNSSGEEVYSFTNKVVRNAKVNKQHKHTGV